MSVQPGAGSIEEVACETTGSRPVSIGDILLERGKISPEHLQAALAARKTPYDRLDRILVQMGFVNERDVLEVLGEQMSIPVVDLSQIEIAPDVLKEIPA